MPSRFNRAKPLILLPCIVYCASCAPLSQTCIRCSLTCDGEPELKKHQSVHVLVEQRSDTVLDQIHNVSSLCDGGSCSVPGCFQRDTRYSLKIYAHDETVPKVLIDRTDVQPDCPPEGVSDSDRSKSEGKLKDINDDETDCTEPKNWVLVVAVSSVALLVLVVLLALIIFAVKKRQRRLRNTEWAPVSRLDLGEESKSESKGFEMQAVNQTNN